MLLREVTFCLSFGSQEVWKKLDRAFMKCTQCICIFVFILFCLSTSVHVFLDLRALSSDLYVTMFFWCVYLKKPPQLVGRGGSEHLGK